MTTEKKKKGFIFAAPFYIIILSPIAHFSRPNHPISYITMCIPVLLGLHSSCGSFLEHSSFTPLLVLTTAKGWVQMSCRLSFAPHSPELKNCFFPEEIPESRESYMVVFFPAKPSTLRKTLLNKIPFFTWFLWHLCIVWDLTSKIKGPCGGFVQLTQIPSVISLNYVVSYPSRQLKIPSVAFQSLTSVLRQHFFVFL